MNVNARIEKIFENFEVDSEKIPIFYQFYEGQAKKYLTYYSWLETPDNFADDTYHAEVCHLTIDVWSTKNFTKICENVKSKMRENGFIWTGTDAEFFERETGYYHVPINFCIAENLTQKE